MAAAFGDALHFLECPVQEPVGALRLARLDHAGGVETGGVHLAGAHVAGFDEVGEHVVGAGARGGQVDVRRIPRRRLEQTGEQGGLRQVDLAHGLAEVELRGRLHAEGAAAQIGAIEIHLEDLELREAGLEQQGEEGLLDLARERALERQEQVLGELLGDRRAALHHVVGARVLEQRARGAEDVDAEVLEEAPVLGGQRGLDEVIGDVFQFHGIVVQDAALADLGAVRSMNLTAYRPVVILFSSNSLRAGMASTKSTAKPPAPSVSASETSSLPTRFHPDRRKRAKKLEKAL